MTYFSDLPTPGVFSVLIARGAGLRSRKALVSRRRHSRCSLPRFNLRRTLVRSGGGLVIADKLITDGRRAATAGQRGAEAKDAEGLGDPRSEAQRSYGRLPQDPQARQEAL